GSISSLSSASQTARAHHFWRKSTSTVPVRSGARCWAMTIERLQSWSRRESRRARACMPPQDAPITARLLARSLIPSRHSPVDLLLMVELLVGLSVGREVDRLLLAQGQDAEAHKALEEQVVNLVLQVAVEVDHHVAAQDE